MSFKPSLEGLDSRIVPAVVRGRPMNPYFEEMQAARIAIIQQQRQQLPPAIQINSTDSPGQLPIKGINQAEKTLEGDTNAEVPSIIPGGKMGPRRTPGTWLNPLTRPEGVVFQRYYY